MGRGVHCSIEKRRIIWGMYQNGTSQVQISNTLNISRKMVYNAIKDVKINRNLLTTKKKRKTPGRKTTTRQDKAIVRKSRADPFKSAPMIAGEINAEFGLNVSSRLISRRLNDAHLFGRISRKKPLLSKRNIEARLSFAGEHLENDIQYWKRVLFSDESKINRVSPDGKTYVYREKCQEFNAKYTQKTVKHGGGNIKVWGCFSWRGVGPLVRIDGNMDKFAYLSILKNTMEPYVFHAMPLNWIFMHDNDPKHTAKVVKNWLSAEKINCLPWPAQSPDLNPIENLWNDVKVKVGAKKYKSLDELWAATKEAWYDIPVEKCRNLVESLPRRCDAVLKNNGHSTKY